MMKKRFVILLAALMLGALVFAAIGAVRADADVGNFNDYGDGGGGDYGGGVTAAATITVTVMIPATAIWPSSSAGCFPPPSARTRPSPSCC